MSVTTYFSGRIQTNFPEKFHFNRIATPVHKMAKQVKNLARNVKYPELKFIILTVCQYMVPYVIILIGYSLKILHWLSKSVSNY